jgi:hypothetical protein
VNLHAIEQMPLRGRRRVDGVEHPKFDFHTGEDGSGSAGAGGALAGFGALGFFSFFLTSAGGALGFSGCLGGGLALGALAVVDAASGPATFWGPTDTSSGQAALGASRRHSAWTWRSQRAAFRHDAPATACLHAM